MTNSFNQFFKDLFDIHDGKEQEEKIIHNIRKNIEFRGSNFWTLIFAIIIASVGLNINSTPVIIGAMLISPLMGPIVGLGLAIGTNDFYYLRKSAKHLGIATVIGIVVSTLYFYLSPIDNVQSELLARISPTIYDILIAFFGGLAGIIGSTRLEKGNVIPGVAIATALMPPLCTAGFGIATAQPSFFFGALYLYAINCIFICLATLVGVKYLHLPPVSPVHKSQSVRTKKLIALVVIIMMAPSIYFANTFVQENNFNQNVEKYLRFAFGNNGYAMIYKNVDYKSSPHKIEVAFLTKHFNLTEINELKNLLPSYQLENSELVIKQDNTSLTEEEWNNVISSVNSESEKVKAIEAKLSSGYISEGTTPQILNEALSINPKISKLAIGNLTIAENQTNASSTSPTPEEQTVLTAIFYIRPEAKPLSLQEETILTDWIRARLQNERILVYFLVESK
jgi:uncharacterized hydrophobic protein (TIGR00271 family)